MTSRNTVLLLKALASILVAAFFMAPALAAHGIPVDPSSSPATINDPHAWLEYLGYYGEMFLLVASGSMFLGVITLLFQRRARPAAIIFGVLILQAIVALALPGVLILAETEWLKTVEARMACVNVVRSLLFLYFFIFAITPIAIAKARKQPKNWLICTITASALCAVTPILWMVAIHFAFYTEKEKINS